MASETDAQRAELDLHDDYKYGFHDEEKPVFKVERGLSHNVVRQISEKKNEPQWMREFRHEALDVFFSKPMPNWGSVDLLNSIQFDDIYYYVKPEGEQAKDWDMVPESIKDTYEKLGIPEAERQYLAGVTAQYESEVVYHKNREDLERQGVIFADMDTALREHPEIVKELTARLDEVGRERPPLGDKPLLMEPPLPYVYGREENARAPGWLVRAVDEFPMTVTGKMQKFVMRDRMAEELGLVERVTA